MTLGSVSLEELRKNFTEEEIVILLNTQEKFRYIARDSSGELCLFSAPPFKKINSDEDFMWWNSEPTVEECPLLAYPHLFKDIKWEDEEPYKFR